MTRFGTCSWKYPSWKGIIYSDKSKSNYLKDYSAYFSTVEVDQWFWSLFPPNKVVLPDKNVVQEYKDSVPEDFLFTIKVPNSITLTHFYNRGKKGPLKTNPYFLSASLFEEFIETLEPAANNIGCLIFQFEYLNKQKMSSLPVFMEKLYEFHSNLPKDLPPIGIEVRNPNYLKPPFFELLNKLNISMAFLEGYFMPPVLEVYNNHKKFIKKLTVLRLHGPDRKGMEKLSNEKWNKIYVQREDEIKSIVEMIKDLQQNEVDLFVNVNNHFEGSAPLTISRLKERL
jgi:uncharacterized protein YecE (DUF72 family)